MSKLTDITTGWLNYAKDNLGILEPEIKALGEARSKICSTCPLAKSTFYGYVCNSDDTTEAVKSFKYYNENRVEGVQYSGCGCPLDKAVLSPGKQCPTGKW